MSSPSANCESNNVGINKNIILGNCAFGFSFIYKEVRYYFHGVLEFRSLGINLFKCIITSSSCGNCIIWELALLTVYLPRRAHQSFKIIRQRCVKLNT